MLPYLGGTGRIDQRQRKTDRLHQICRSLSFALTVALLVILEHQLVSLIFEYFYGLLRDGCI